MKQIDSQTRLKSLLRELFQLDVADLDFGLYRLFRLKRDEVEAFLNKQLPAEVDRAFEAAAGTEREALQKRVDDLAERARATVADDAILPSGEPDPAHAVAKAVREYAEVVRGVLLREVTQPTAPAGRGPRAIPTSRRRRSSSSPPRAPSSSTTATGTSS